MKFATPTNNRVRQARAAFTLAEVLAAMLFIAIVIPVAVEAVHIASLSGEVAERKAIAARIADRVLNESIVMTNWSGMQNGTVTENGRDFSWTLHSQAWQEENTMTLLTAEVSFTAQGKQYAVHLDTVVDSQ